MLLTHTLDWLTFTVEGKRELSELFWLADELFRGATALPTKANHGYKWAVRTREGFVLQSGVRDDMHTNISCSGSSLSDYSDMWSDWEDHLAEILSSARNVSRIDLAIDIRDKNILPDLVALVRAKAYKCAAQSFKVIESDKAGKTLYLGERSSERMMRIYDKAAQMNVPTQPWTRLELEVKGEAAKRCAKAIQEHGLFRVCRDWIIAFAWFDIPVWHSLQVRSFSSYAPSQRKASDTRAWLFYTIAPILANLVAMGDDNILDEFVAVVRSYD